MKKRESKTRQKQPRGAFEEAVPKPLDEIDHLIIRLKIEQTGIAESKIAKLLNLHRSTIADRSKNPRFQLQLAELMKPATKILQELQPISAHILKKHLSAKIRLKDGSLVDDVDTQVKIALEISKPNIKQTIRLEHAGDELNPINIKETRELSDEELERIIKNDKPS